jgi:hypothetical protein
MFGVQEKLSACRNRTNSGISMHFTVHRHGFAPTPHEHAGSGAHLVPKAATLQCTELLAAFRVRLQYEVVPVVGSAMGLELSRAVGSN